MNDAGRIGFLIRGDYINSETYNFLDIVYYNGSSYVAKKTTTGNLPNSNNEFWHIFATGGGSSSGGVTNYSELENLPQINSVTLDGNKSLEDLGIPTKTSELVNDEGFKTTDNDTWKANTASNEGYVSAGSGHANQVWKTDANGVPGWRPDENTTYGVATQSANGLMSAADKNKLGGIAEGANKTTLTTSLAVTQSGVSALDGSVGKILKDDIDAINSNLGGVILWENPSPSSSMAEQNITVNDMSRYKYIKFFYRAHKSHSQYMMNETILGNGIILVYSTANSAGAISVVTRPLNYINETTFKIGDAQRSYNGTLTSQSDANEFLIPIRIVGIR